jgi:hypothetical protein
MEEYKIIKNFENFSVSNLGNVKNNIKNKILKQYTNKGGYKTVCILGKNKLVHRLVAEAFIPNLENKPCIDHINNIRNDNRLENLRFASYIENGQNSSIKKNNTSGYKGVSYDYRDFWRADIYHNGKRIFIGRFDTKEEASAARKKAELQYHSHRV